MRNILLIFSTSMLFLACAKVPITGRRQVQMLPESQLMSMSLTSYDDFLKTNKTQTTGSDAEMVKKVGDKIALAVEAYMHGNGHSKRIKNYKWEFNFVDDPTVNAWCMPGGKVVVYSGIMPVAQTEEGLAVVMGHEIAHAIARHGNERMSQQLLVQAGGVGLQVAMNDKPDLTKDLFLSSYGIGSQLGSLKYSRSHETEADKMGLVFMTMAGYNPYEAVNFWGRMAAQGGAKPPEMLSTHPSDDSRIKAIEDYIPIAETYATKK